MTFSYISEELVWAIVRDLRRDAARRQARPRAPDARPRNNGTGVWTRLHLRPAPR
jgi:hypothetical protein